VSEGTWYITPDDGPVDASDDETYDEAYGPSDPTDADGRLIDEEAGPGRPPESEVYGSVAVGDTHGKSAEESAIHVRDEAEMDLADDLDDDLAPPDLS
jgi:hypothetical protein